MTKTRKQQLVKYNWKEIDSIVRLIEYGYPSKHIVKNLGCHRGDYAIKGLTIKKIDELREFIIPL